MQFKKISIIGISGSGKSTYSRKLAKQTHLPLFHMDQLFWKDNWQAVPEQEYLQAHENLIQQDSWIIEGYIDDSMSERLRKSDLVIFLDYPGWLCAWWVFKRWLRHRKESRPELPKEALEELKGEFLWRVLSRKERIPLMEALEIANSSNLKIVHSPKELNKLVLL